jgi:peptidylprolyl isomerase/FK506-binding protein 1
MSWQKTILKPGNGTDMPSVGANVKIDYTGWLRDSSNPDHEKGKEYVLFHWPIVFDESNSLVFTDSTPPKVAAHWLLPSAEVGLSRVSYTYYVDDNKAEGLLIDHCIVPSGWDEGVLSMTLGEEAILTIDS